MDIRLEQINGSFTIYKYPPAAAPMLWPELLALSEPTTPTSFFTVSITDKELSIVTSAVLTQIDGYFFHTEPGYSAFGIMGKLDFGLVGILAKLTTALANDGIPVFAVSTFDTDYILVKTENAGKAKQALVACGCSFA
ncbi:ACT domain-containing protein [Chytridium lagenaria]|nr:ACT domain-containing protein [Chytridium lagenaria]